MDSSRRASTRLMPSAAPSATPSGGDIEELSIRLAALADRINESNAAKRGVEILPRPVGEHLPSFLSAPKKELRPREIAPDVEFGNTALPGSIDPRYELPRLPNAGAEGRLWPQLPTQEQTAIRAFESKIDEQTEELNKRYVQIADLCNIRLTQAGELQIACDQIDALGKSVAELQQMVAQRDLEAATAAQELTRAENETETLQAQLNAALNVSAELSQRLLDVEATLNDKIVNATASREAAERIEAELAAVQTETSATLAAVEERETLIKARENLIRDEERNLLVARFEKRISELQSIIVDRDREAVDFQNAYAELADCCTRLSKTILALEDAQQNAGAEIQSQGAHIEFLEAVLKVERENSKATIDELIAEFQREREQILENERASAEIRKNIVQLLPRLAARRNEPVEPEHDIIDVRAQVA